jgi:predicted Zn-dependent protease
MPFGFSRGYGSGFGGRRGPMGCNPRLLIALVIAVIAIVGYLAKRSTNPTTGETQYVALSPDQEIALGLQAAPQMAQQMGGVVPESEPSAAMVEEVGRHIVASSDAKNSPYVKSFDFHLLKDPQTINAFALPGGQIFITRALYDKLENEAQLAGVLAHEIGHVIHRHAAEHMAKGELGGMLATAVGVGASDDGQGGRGRGMGAAVAAQMANQIIQLRFGRKDETESDTYGLRYMVQSGYDPRAMLDVMEVLKNASKSGRTPEILATHPAPQDRLDDIARRIKELLPSGVPSELTTGRRLP